eukprot:4960608-Prymnesium_polylepis.1
MQGVAAQADSEPNKRPRTERRQPREALAQHDEAQKDVEADAAEAADLWGGAWQGHLKGDHWAVDSLLAKRFRKGRVQYLVHWSGWSSDFDSWEWQQGIDQTSIDEFEAAQRQVR